MGIFLSLALLLGGVGWPFQSNPAQLELVEVSHVYAPGDPIQVRLTNRGESPIYFITEVRRGMRTAEGKRLPGSPVYERRRLKFFFRSDRWVYATGAGARFRPAVLEPGDSVVFPVSFSQESKSKYKVHFGYWRRKDIEDTEQFLKSDVQEIEKRYSRRVRWVSTPSFRIRASEPEPAAKK